MEDKKAPEKKPSGLTSTLPDSCALNSGDHNPDNPAPGRFDFNRCNLNFSRKSPSAATTATVTTILNAGIMAVVAFAMIIALSAGVASAYPAQYLESGTAWGYTPGDISGLKDEYPADFAYYHISWIKIVPESDTDEWGAASDYICTLKTPHGKEIYIRPGIDVFYTPPGDDTGGLFNDAGMGYYSVNISSLVAGAKADMIPWRGTWTVDYFFNRKDSKNPPDYAFITNTTFTVYDDYTPTPTPTPESVSPKTTPAIPEGFFPAGSYTSDTSGGDSGTGSGAEATVRPAAGYTETPDTNDGLNTTGSDGNDNGIYIWIIAAAALIVAVIVIVRVIMARNRDDYYL